jgi:hypothetical protein
MSDFEELKCQHCGASLEPNTLKCPYCGFQHIPQKEVVTTTTTKTETSTNTRVEKQPVSVPTVYRDRVVYSERKVYPSAKKIAIGVFLALVIGLSLGACFIWATYCPIVITRTTTQTVPQIVYQNRTVTVYVNRTVPEYIYEYEQTIYENRSVYVILYANSSGIQVAQQQNNITVNSYSVSFDVYRGKIGVWVLNNTSVENNGTYTPSSYYWVNNPNNINESLINETLNGLYNGSGSWNNPYYYSYTLDNSYSPYYSLYGLNVTFVGKTPTQNIILIVGENQSPIYYTYNLGVIQPNETELIYTEIYGTNITTMGFYGYIPYSYSPYSYSTFTYGI